MVAVVGVVIWAAIAAGQAISKPSVTGDIVTKKYSEKPPCDTIDIALAVPAGADQSEVAETLFTALGGVPGMAAATYDIKASSVEVGFCESGANEASIRAAIAPTGLLAQGAAPAAPATETPAPAAQ